MAFAQSKDITTPVSTMTSKGSAHQIPKTLCQFQSRALPRNPAGKAIEARTVFQFYLRGTQRARPSRISAPNRRLDIPIWITQAPRGTVEELRPYSRFFDIGAIDLYPVAYPRRTFWNCEQRPQRSQRLHQNHRGRDESSEAGNDDPANLLERGHKTRKDASLPDLP